MNRTQTLVLGFFVVAWGCLLVILVAFLFGVLRVPAAVLQLTGILTSNVPAWYVDFQGLLGAVQLGIGLAMSTLTGPYAPRSSLHRWSSRYPT